MVPPIVKLAVSHTKRIGDRFHDPQFFLCGSVTMLVIGILMSDSLRIWPASKCPSPGSMTSAPLPLTPALNMYLRLPIFFVALDKVLSELRRSGDFYQTHFSKQPIQSSAIFSVVACCVVKGGT